MLYLSENIKKYRLLKNLTQEDLAAYLHITPQSVSKWERGESYPDIEFLPALANLLETSVDLLLGMDTIRAEETYCRIHAKASELQKNGDYSSAEKVYRDALLIYPNKPGMMLGLAGVLALQNRSEEAVQWMERGIPLSANEKQKATARAVLCFLYLKTGKLEKASRLAAALPHARESREAIQPLIRNGLGEDEMQQKIRCLLVGEE